MEAVGPAKFFAETLDINGNGHLDKVQSLWTPSSPTRHPHPPVMKPACLGLGLTKESSVRLRVQTVTGFDQYQAEEGETIGHGGPMWVHFSPRLGPVRSHLQPCRAACGSMFPVPGPDALFAVSFEGCLRPGVETAQQATERAEDTCLSTPNAGRPIGNRLDFSL